MFIQLRSCDPINLTYLFQISNKNLMLENHTNNKIHTTRLENMLVCRHSTGSLRNAQVSFFFFFFLMLILEKKSFSYRYIILAMITLPGEQSKLLVLSSASFFNSSYCFDFSYLLSSAQVSFDG